MNSHGWGISNISGTSDGTHTGSWNRFEKKRSGVFAAIELGSGSGSNMATDSHRNEDSSAESNDESTSLEELKDERAILQEALLESFDKLCELNSCRKADEKVVSQLKELCIIIEPSLAEIKDVDLKIQNELKRLKLRTELVKEIKSSRAYAAKLQVALNRARELESNFDSEFKSSNRSQNI